MSKREKFDNHSLKDLHAPVDATYQPNKGWHSQPATATTIRIIFSETQL
jgi:hypothetical protein